MFGEPHGRVLPPALVLLVAGFALLAAPGAYAQEAGIVFNQVTVTGAEASLQLELEGDRDVSVAFRDERILVDGQEVGRFTSGGELERSWRGLLAQAIAADNAELRALLLAWTPPDVADADARAGALAVQDRLEAALTAPAPSAPATPRTPLRADEGPQRLLELLVQAPDRLRELTAAVQGLDVENLRVHAGEDVTIGEGESSASILILDGDLTLDGEVDGDAVILGGRIALGEAARITGDLRWSEAVIEGDRGAVAGTISEISPVPAQPDAQLRDQIRQQALDAAERALAQTPPTPPVRSQDRFFPRGLLRGMAGLFQTLLTFGILLGAGLILLYFFPRNLEVIARTARNATGRSALVGLAGFVLAFPTWIMGIIVLAVSIIGIPVLLIWTPGFPLALAIAVAIGYLAVARNLGHWASGQEIQGLEGFDTSRPAVQIGGGLMLLLAPFALAYVFQMAGPWFGFFRGLLLLAGVSLTALVACVGLGAVLLSRGGKDSAFAGQGWRWGGDPDPWAPEPDDPLAGGPGAGREAGVGAERGGAAPPSSDEPAGSPRDPGPGEPPGDGGERHDA